MTIAVGGSLLFAQRQIQKRHEEQTGPGSRPLEKTGWEERVAQIEAAQQSSVNTGQQAQEQSASTGLADSDKPQDS